jgi:erythromycin esterase-like protein
VGRRDGAHAGALLHAAGRHDKLLLTRELSELARARRGHRAIGVVYDPARERGGAYVPTDLPARYDALISLDATEALHPLHIRPREPGPPDTYPWGL